MDATAVPSPLPRSCRRERPVPRPQRHPHAGRLALFGIWMGGGAFACGPALPVGQAPKNSSHKDTRFRHQRPSGWRRLLPGSRGGGIQNAFFGFYWGFFWGNYKKFRIHSGTCSSLNEFPSVSPPPKKYRLVQYSGFYCV